MTRRALAAAGVLALAAAAVVSVTLGLASAQAATARANLVLTLAGSAHTVSAGQTVTYTATVRNNGPDAATTVRLRDWLPGKATFVSATAAQGSCSGRPVVCQLGPLDAGSSTSATFTVTAKGDGWMADQARVWSDLPDPHPFNNVRIARTFVQATHADLGVGVAVSPRPAHVGQNVTYTLTVHDHGPAGATGVVVKDWLPGKTSFVSSSSSQGSCAVTRPVVCSLGSLASGQSATVTLVAAVNRGGELQNEARVHGDQPDPARFNNVRFSFVHAA